METIGANGGKIVKQYHFFLRLLERVIVEASK